MLRKAVLLVLVFVTSFIEHHDAVTVTEPSGSTTWHLHSPNMVEWQSVQTDPESLEIRIVNNNNGAYPTGFTHTIKDGINTADNKFTIESLPGIKPGHGYQVNLMSSAGTILAQSAQFSINGTTEANSTMPTHFSTPTIAQPTQALSAPTAAATSEATAKHRAPIDSYLGSLAMLMFLSASLSCTF